MSKEVVKETTSKKRTATTTTALPKRKSFTVSLPNIKFPDFTSQLSQSYLVFALVVLAFLLGMLTNKVIYLESQVKTVQQNTNAQAAAAAPTAVPTPPDYVTVGNGHFPLKGNANAKVTVVEFADLRCPFCERFFTDAEQQFIKEYVDTGKVKFAFRHYAFLGPASTVAANAAECANAQGKFWEMHDYLYQNQPDESDTSMYNTNDLSQIAGNLGMDTSKFSTCLDANQYSKNVDGDIADGTKVQVDGTPTFFINGHRVVGAVPYTQFKQVVDQELAKAK